MFWYVLLQIGVPIDYPGYDPDHHIEVVRHECKVLGVAELKRLNIVQESYKRSLSGRYLFALKGYARDVRLLEG